MGFRLITMNHRAKAILLLLALGGFETTPPWIPSSEAQELSLSERDKLLKGIYYYQVKISPLTRRLNQVRRTLQGLLADPMTQDRTLAIGKAISDKDQVFSAIKELYDNFESYYNFKISLKSTYIPEVEVAKNEVIALVNTAIGEKKKIEEIAVGGHQQTPLPQNPPQPPLNKTPASPDSKVPEPSSSPSTPATGSSDDLTRQLFGGGEQSPPPSISPAPTSVPEEPEKKPEKPKLPKTGASRFEKKLYKPLDSENDRQKLEVNGDLTLRGQVQKETSRGDTLGRDFGDLDLKLAWNPSRRWQVDFRDNLRTQYFLNHWVRNELLIDGLYQHSARAYWNFATDVQVNYFSTATDLDYNNWACWVNYNGDFGDHDEFNGRFTLENEWYPHVSFNDLWRFRGDLGFDTVFDSGARFHIDGGTWHENLKSSDRFDNTNGHIAADWFRQFESGETWSIANTLRGKSYDTQNSAIFISNSWEDNLVLEYHNPLSNKTEFSTHSDFFIKDYGVMDERDFLDYLGRMGIHHFWRDSHSLDAGMSFAYHDDGLDAKSHYKFLLDFNYKNKLSENLLLEVMENFENRTTKSGTLLDSAGNDFIVNFTWFFSDTFYPGLRLGSLLKYYDSPLFSDYSKFLGGLNFKYKFGQRGTLFAGSDLYPTYYRNGNTTAGDHFKFMHKSEIRVETPLSDSWSVSLRGRAENRMDNMFSTLTDELLEDYSKELDLAAIDIALNVTF